VTVSLQDQHAPGSICFGCGPANAKGLRLRSFPEGDAVVADFLPESHHQAFPGMLNGGIIGTLLDCHSRWTASWHLMNKTSASTLPCTVTADFHVRLRRPTPFGPVKLRAAVSESTDTRAVVFAELFAAGRVTATCTATFVVVNEGHPALRGLTEA
jgi:acyl-coenzyme A thioesterase PaaI-like protein